MNKKFEEGDIAITVPSFNKCFIYFLIKDEVVVYVGQTQKGLIRPFAHQYDKEYDEIKIIYCEQKELDMLEDKYIKKYQPIYNKTVNLAMNYSLHRARDKIRKMFNNNCFYLPELKKIIKKLNINIYQNNGISYITIDDFEKIIKHIKGVE